jgi:NAD(P)-dependent dehydrogenase (short-subunit alcohol dehydrogenase family)
MNTVIVIGAAGLIGSGSVKQFALEGFEAVGGTGNGRRQWLFGQKPILNIQAELAETQTSCVHCWQERFGSTGNGPGIPASKSARTLACRQIVDSDGPLGTEPEKRPHSFA